MTAKQQNAHTINQTLYQSIQKDAFVARWCSYKYLSVGANWTMLTRKKTSLLFSWSVGCGKGRDLPQGQTFVPSSSLEKPYKQSLLIGLIAHWSVFH